MELAMAACVGVIAVCSSLLVAPKVERMVWSLYPSDRAKKRRACQCAKHHKEKQYVA